MNAPTEIKVAVTPDLTAFLRTFDVLIEEMTLTRDRLRHRLAYLIELPPEAAAAVSSGLPHTASEET